MAAQAPKTSQSSSLAIAQAEAASQYAFRGLVYDNKPVLQTQLIGAYGPLTAIGFANFSFNPKTVNELDAIVEYSRPLGPISLTVGAAHYTFPNTEMPATSELYAAVTDFLALGRAKILPKLLVVKDIDEDQGLYIEAFVDNALATGKYTISGQLFLGFNDKYYRTSTGCSHVGAQLAVDIHVNDRLMFRPRVLYSKAVGNEMTDEAVAAVMTRFAF